MCRVRTWVSKVRVKIKTHILQMFMVQMVSFKKKKEVLELILLASPCGLWDL